MPIGCAESCQTFDHRMLPCSSVRFMVGRRGLSALFATAALAPPIVVLVDLPYIDSGVHRLCDSGFLLTSRVRHESPCARQSTTPHHRSEDTPRNSEADCSSVLPRLRAPVARLRICKEPLSRSRFCTCATVKAMSMAGSGRNERDVTTCRLLFRAQCA